MRAILAFGLLGAVLTVGGCAGRDANPEPVDWVYDHYYTSKDIRAEKARIQQAMQDRGIEEATIHRNDDARIARSIPLVPGLASVTETRMSSSEPTPQQVEIDALKARDAHLDGMAADRGC
jgi:hypothetical protein